MNKLLVARESVKTAYFKEQGLKNSSTPRKKSYDLPYASPRKLSAPRESVLLCCLILCLVITSIGLITQYGRIVAGSFQAHQMRREIAQLQEERVHLRLEVKQLSSLERIEAIAVNDLGLQYPEKRQWLLLSARGN